MVEPTVNPIRVWFTLLTNCGAAAVLGVAAVVLAVHGHAVDGRTSPLFPAVARGIEGLNGWSVIFLIVAGFILGVFGRVHPLLVGLATIPFFPMMSVADVIVDSTSHNLLPFEWAIYVFLTVPGILGAFAGRRFKRSVSGDGV
jgi:hypothetical protein